MIGASKPRSLVTKVPFLKGCGNLKVETLKKDEGSNTHLFAKNKHANEKVPSKAPAFIAKMSINKAIYSKLTVLFGTVHAINVNARPARDYIWMNELDTMKGNLGHGVCYSTNEEFGNLSWQKVHRRFGNEYRHALSIFDLVLSIPVTSTACERGFTHMKLIKSNRRSLLKEA